MIAISHSSGSARVMPHYTDSDSEDGRSMTDGPLPPLDSATDSVLRKRQIWHPEEDTMPSEIKDLLDDDGVSLAEEEDGAGCPLPSTPEDQLLLDAEVYKISDYFY